MRIKIKNKSESIKKKHSKLKRKKINKMKI